MAERKTKTDDEPQPAAETASGGDIQQKLDEANEQGYLGEQPEQADEDQDLTVEGVTKDKK